MDISVVLGCQLRKTKLMVDPKELLLPEQCVKEAFLRVEPNILPGEVIEMVTILLNQRNIMVEIIKEEDPPKPTDFVLDSRSQSLTVHGVRGIRRRVRA